MKKRTILLWMMLLPMLIRAQVVISYKKAVPSISAKGIITLPGNNKKISIEGFNDKNYAVFFIVRHAEKDTMGGTNADLNAIGRGRAEALVQIFKQVPIAYVFSTDRPRTKNTAQPLAVFKKHTVEIYDAGKQNILLDSLLKTHRGKKIFMVGHSNTAPQLVNILRGASVEKDLADDNYSTLYIVSAKKIGGAKVQVINF